MWIEETRPKKERLVSLRMLHPASHIQSRLDIPIFNTPSLRLYYLGVRPFAAPIPLMLNPGKYRMVSMLAQPMRQMLPEIFQSPATVGKTKHPGFVGRSISKHRRAARRTCRCCAMGVAKQETLFRQLIPHLFHPYIHRLRRHRTGPLGESKVDVTAKPRRQHRWTSVHPAAIQKYPVCR